MPRIIQATVFAVLLFSLPAQAQHELIGNVVPPYPEGTSSEMGKCISDGDNDECQFAIATLNAANGAVIGVLATKRLNPHADGQNDWHVFDALNAPALGKGQMWAIEECYRNGVPDPAMIGIVTYQDKGGWVETDETIWAVRFDLGIQKLLIVSTTEVPQCVLPGS